MTVTASLTPLEELMVSRQESVDPSAYADEIFDLFSIPAYDKGEPEVIAGREIGSSKKVVEPGDVLLSRIVPHIRRAWVVPDANGRRQIASGEWIVFRGKTFDSAYLRHLLMSDVFHVQFMNTVAGVGGSLLRARPAYVAKIEIPLPPLSEQKRIADILDKADAIRRKRQEAIEATEMLLGSAFQGTFGDPVARSSSTKTISLGDADIHISDGNYSSKYPKAADFLSSGVPFIRANNLRRLTVIGDDMRFISEDQHSELKKGHLKEKDVLIVTRGNIGEVALVPPQYANANINAQLVLLRPTSRQFTSEFLLGFFAAPAVRVQVMRLQTGTALKQLPVGQLVQLPLPVPTETQLEKFTAIFRNQQKTLRTQLEHRDESVALFNSLVQRAFKGEL